MGVTHELINHFMKNAKNGYDDADDGKMTMTIRNE